MAKYIIHTYSNNGRTAKVYQNAQFEEFEVRFSDNGVDLPAEADYFCNDVNEAKEAASDFVNEEG